MPPRTPPESGGVKIIVVTSIFTTLATIAVVLRVVAAKLQKRSLCWHDFLIFAAWIWMAGYSSCAIIGVMIGGSGSHVHRIVTNPRFGRVTLVAGLKNFFAAAFLWACATCLCKLSVLLLYKQLFPTRQFRNMLYIMIGVVAMLWIGLVLTGFFICSPLALNWDKTIDGHCGSTTAEEVAFAAVNLAVDASIVALPLPIVWNLEMATQKKIEISCLFGLGFVVCVMNAARIGTILAADQADYLYTLINVAIFSGLEVQLGIVAACAPLLKPLLSLFSSKETLQSSSDAYKGHWKYSKHSRSPVASSDGQEESLELGSKQYNRAFDTLKKTSMERVDDDVPPPRKDYAPAQADESLATARAKALQDKLNKGTAAGTDKVQVTTDISISSTARSASPLPPGLC